MVKIFALNNHRELERIVNNWIKTNNITIIKIHYSTCNSDDDIIYTILIQYQSYNDKPC